ncbi:MAG TPA: SDR family oxidoreductase [Pyrinomonadaceae bacterium]|nr:SDR family oxidoreductase [Pyrinomonadaceae bacterium]
MQKVVLITGASSGIGKETAKLFQTKDWKVAATMREPQNAQDLSRIADIECFRMDVSDPASVHSAIEEALSRFGLIDAVVNNAGYGLIGAFEAATDDEVRRQFEVNVFGVMNVCREILPYFREQKRGVIVNISSVGGRLAFPLSSLYHATKWAVEGFSESLQYELEPFNIRVKIIEPGPIKTDFYDRSMSVAKREGLTAYDETTQRLLKNSAKAAENAPDGSVVAQVIYDAVTDKSGRLRYGANTKGILAIRRVVPFPVFRRLIKKIILG